MDTRDRLLDLIQQLYAAPGTVDGWQPFLESLRIALHGSAVSLLSEDLQSQQCSFEVTTLANAEAILLYNRQWGADDPWAHSPNSARLSERSVIVGDELIAHRDVQRTPYYQDFARHYDIVRAFIGVLEATPTALSVVSISGSERRRPFCERDVALLEPLVPHIRRALQLHRRLVAADGAASDLATVFDNISRAVFLVDAKGRVTFTNRAASRLTAMRDGLAVEHGELRAARAADTARLRSLLADAIRASNGSGLATSTRNGIRAGGALRLGRPSGRRALTATVAPFTRRPLPFSGIDRPVAVVIVSDPERVPLPDEGTLRDLYGLTPAETALTRVLAEGATLDDAAARLGLRIGTVRTRLKTIFEKTGTHRQADLVRLVLLGSTHL